MTKKLVVLITVAFLQFCLAACGSAEKSNPQQDIIGEWAVFNTTQTYQFYPDGTGYFFEASFDQGSFTWSIDEDILRIRYEWGEEINIKFRFIGTTSMNNPKGDMEWAEPDDVFWKESMTVQRIR